MATVVVNSVLRNRLGPQTGEAPESIEVDAGDVRGLIKELDRRYPGSGEQLKSGVAVAIDGEIFQEPLFEELEADSEVYFLPAIEGG